MHLSLLVQLLDLADEALEGGTEAQLTNIVMRDELINVGAPHTVQMRLVGILFGEPEAMLSMDNAGLDNRDNLGLEFALAKVLSLKHI